MSQQQDFLHGFLADLIEGQADEKTLKILELFFHAVIRSHKCLAPENHPVPYHEITRFIYNYEKHIGIEDLNMSLEALEMQIISNADVANGSLDIFRKFKNHISLAATQKYYIQKVADNAFNTASEAKSVAQEAGEQANKAKLTYDGMMVNYITILGIFASIIITIFGGMQIISATTGLLQADLNIATLILVLSFLTFLIILILWMLFTFISNLKSEGKKNYAILVSLVILSILMAVSGGYMLSLKKQDAPQINTKVLIKNEK